MARPGPPRKPSGLRLLEGTDRFGRTGRTLDTSREPQPLEGPMVPPYDMAAGPRRVWDATVVQLEAMGIARPADAFTLAGYCEAASLFERASLELVGEKLTPIGARGTPTTNKLVLIQRHAAELMLRFAAEFGLSPASRARVEVQLPSSPAGDNPFAGW